MDPSVAVNTVEHKCKVSVSSDIQRKFFHLKFMV